MLNKNLFLLLTVLFLASCHSNIDSNKIVAESKNAEETDKLFSISADEIKRSEGSRIIHFDTNSAKLDAEAIATLNQRILPKAKKPETTKVVIEAHCDERGSKNYNKKLSKRRARAVRNYLVKNGIKSSKIKTIGYGESKPVALDHDEAAWYQNRRAVTISIE